MQESGSNYHRDENGQLEDVYGDVSDDVWMLREQLNERSVNGNNE